MSLKFTRKMTDLFHETRAPGVILVCEDGLVYVQDSNLQSGLEAAIGSMENRAQQLLTRRAFSEAEASDSDTSDSDISEQTFEYELSEGVYDSSDVDDDNFSDNSFDSMHVYRTNDRRSSEHSRHATEELNVQQQNNRNREELPVSRIQSRKRKHEDMEDIPAETEPQTTENETASGSVTCPVCMLPHTDVISSGRHMVSVGCGHVFCNECTERIVKTLRRRCPMCRARVFRREIRTIYFDYRDSR